MSLMNHFFKKFVFGHMGFDLLCWSNNGFLMMFTKILKLLSVLFHDAFVDYVLIFWSKNFNCYTGDRRLIPTQLTAIHLASEWRDIDLHSVYNCENRLLSLLQFNQIEIEISTKKKYRQHKIYTRNPNWKCWN